MVTYDKTTRLLHRLLAAGIVLQLLVSQVMVHPGPTHPGNWLFTVHELTGFAVALVLAAHWAVMAPKYRATPHYLFPWTKADSRAAVLADARATLDMLKTQRRLPETDVPTPLVGAVQGFGLIVASTMAVTGVLMFLCSGPTGLNALGWLAKQVHELFASLLWLYLIVHVGAALAHQFTGQPVITKMFAHKDEDAQG